MFSEIKSVHFVGICGTAMASTAAAMQEKGFQVTGSDQNVYPPMSTFLAERQVGVMAEIVKASFFLASGGRFNRGQKKFYLC